MGKLLNTATAWLAAPAAVAACIVFVAGRAAAQERTWTDVQGRSISARLLGVENERARLRLAGGRVSAVALKELSQPDLDFISSWRSQKIRWPEEIDVRDEVAVEAMREDPANGEFVYRTQHFEFHSDQKIAGSLIKDFSLAFEATFAAVAALPLQLEPQPPEGHFQIRLFGERFDYYAAGGLLGTAGVYVPLRRHILVPMDSLNLKRVGSELRKNNNAYDNSTLIHEITHQVMHDWLKHLPPWMIEGMAEYMSSLPYSNGKFRFSESARKNGLKAALARWGGGRQNHYRILPATTLFTVDSRKWNNASGADAVAHYSSSMLYVYYLMHLDGTGKGERICAFTRDIKRAKPKVAALLEAYESTLRDFVENVREAGENGNVTPLRQGDIPPILRAPIDTVIYQKDSPHRQALERLLGNRSDEQLTKDVISAFDSYGIRLQ